MRIKAVCDAHKDAVVKILQGTTNYKMLVDYVHPDVPQEQYVDEDTEHASIVELDEHNLYCTSNETHTEGDVHFVVI
jgi:hypothetical protein